jgi:hypothetical protein
MEQPPHIKYFKLYEQLMIELENKWNFLESLFSKCNLKDRNRLWDQIRPKDTQQEWTQFIYRKLESSTGNSNFKDFVCRHLTEEAPDLDALPKETDGGYENKWNLILNCYYTLHPHLSTDVADQKFDTFWNQLSPKSRTEPWAKFIDTKLEMYPPHNGFRQAVSPKEKLCTQPSKGKTSRFSFEQKPPVSNTSPSHVSSTNSPKRKSSLLTQTAVSSTLKINTNEDVRPLARKSSLSKMSEIKIETPKSNKHVHFEGEM